MTTAREIDMMRVESRIYLDGLYDAWMKDKLGKRAQRMTDGSRQGNGSNAGNSEAAGPEGGPEVAAPEEFASGLSATGPTEATGEFPGLA